MNTIEYLTALTRRAVIANGSVRKWLTRAKVAESTYYRWLNGKTSPNARTLRRLEDAAESTALPQATAMQTTPEVAAT